MDNEANPPAIIVGGPSHQQSKEVSKAKKGSQKKTNPSRKRQKTLNR